jgi:hypothetical protein
VFRTIGVPLITVPDNSDASSSSPHDDNDDSSSKKKMVNQNYSFDYSRIPFNSNAHLLSIPLGKPPHFDGEDYSFWSHKMRSHLFSLHPSIWEIVENGMHFDSTDNPVFINEQIHKNAQSTIVLLASLCRETLPSKVAQVEAAGLNEDEMTLIIKRFKTALKGRKEYPNKNKTRRKRPCFKCGKIGHFIAQCPDNENDQGEERHGKKEKKKSYRKAKCEAHLGKEWDSDCSSSDSDNEGLAASAFNKSSLFPNERHTCLMAKEKKVSVRDSPKYSTSSDEDSSDDELDYTSLFKGLDRAKIEKINELIDALNEKDRLLERQEDILYEEHDKFVSVQKSLALELKRNEVMPSKISAYHETVSSLKSLNNDLNAKLEGANKLVHV